MKMLRLPCVVAFFLFGAGSAPAGVLLSDDFTAYRAGLFSTTVGAHTEYHYLPEAAPKGNWAVSTFRSSVPSQRAWRIVDHDGRRAMHQTYKNSFPHYHPMIVTGDPAWRDYRIETEMTPRTNERMAGVVFRYRNDRCYYFAGMDGDRAVIKRVNHATAFRKPDEHVLAQAPANWKPGDTIPLVIEARGSALSATINGLELAAEDATFPEGRVALAADRDTLFHAITIEASDEEIARVHAAMAAREAGESALQAANPKMKLWKTIDLKDFGAARNIRFGDLDGDGQIDILIGQVVHHGPKDRNSELSCLTAFRLDGTMLWQIGEPDPWKYDVTNDVAFQIHDLDGDGRSEVVYTMNMEIVVADGATGETKRKAPTPETPPNTRAEHAKFPRILGDSLFFCDLRGTGRDADIILKDRYLSLWALDDKLAPLWSAQCNTGHYPYGYDIDGDGRDELMMGYTLFNPDGTVRWSLDERIQDHADGVAIVPFLRGERPKLLCAASDEGMFFADMDGNITEHYYLGHVQNPAIADFRPDLPGLEAVAINFWGNQGIVHYFDAQQRIYHDFEPAQHGSMCLPINWTGEPGEFWILSANVEEGGLFDGWGRRAVRFPADGHPDMCNAAVDLTGDAREEIVVWDPAELWIYTQDDGPRETLNFVSEKNPLYNYSNYQTTVSTPVP